MPCLSPIQWLSYPLIPLALGGGLAGFYMWRVALRHLEFRADQTGLQRIVELKKRHPRFRMIYAFFRIGTSSLIVIILATTLGVFFPNAREAHCGPDPQPSAPHSFAIEKKESTPDSAVSEPAF